MVVAVGAWVLHVGALALAPLSVVQAVLAGGVVLLAVMAERMFGFQVGPRQWSGLGLTALGLVLLGVTLPAVHGAHSQLLRARHDRLRGRPGRRRRACSSWASASASATEHHGVMLGAAAGILFGVSDVAIKAHHGPRRHRGVVALLLSPWTVVAVAASVAAFYASARGLQDGEAVPVIAITGTAANVSGIAGGIIVFGDPLPGTRVGIVVQALAFLLVIVASALTPAPVRAAQRRAGGRLTARRA